MGNKYREYMYTCIYTEDSIIMKKFKCYLIFNAGYIGQVNLSNTVIHHKDKVISDVKTYSKL